MRRTVPIISQNINNSNVLSDSDSDSNDKNQENLFDEDINEEVKATPKTTINTKVVHAMKKLQALCNHDANKIIKQATQEKVPLKTYISQWIWPWCPMTSSYSWKNPDIQQSLESSQQRISQEMASSSLQRIC